MAAPQEPPITEIQTSNRHTPSSRAQVTGPTEPSTPNPTFFWNASTASSVAGPKDPSTSQPTSFCTARTVSLFIPRFSTGTDTVHTCTGDAPKVSTSTALCPSQNRLVTPDPICTNSPSSPSYSPIRFTPMLSANLATSLGSTPRTRMSAAMPCIWLELGSPPTSALCSLHRYPELISTETPKWSRICCRMSTNAVSTSTDAHLPHLHRNSPNRKFRDSCPPSLLLYSMIMFIPPYTHVNRYGTSSRTYLNTLS